MEKKPCKWAAVVQIFLLYSVVGWLYEEILEVFIYRTGFTNRGFLFGPYLPVYGFGALLFLLFLDSMKRQKRFGPATPLAVFLGSMVIATVVELITGYALRYFGLELWNYDHYALNFEGLIALNPSVRFGLGGLLFLYILQPLFERLIAWQPRRVLTGVSVVISLVLLVDFIMQLI